MRPFFTYYGHGWVVEVPVEIYNDPKSWAWDHDSYHKNELHVLKKDGTVAEVRPIEVLCESFDTIIVSFSSNLEREDDFDELNFLHCSDQF